MSNVQQQQKGERREMLDELMMDFNWGDEIEIYKVGETFPPSIAFSSRKKIIFFN